MTADSLNDRQRKILGNLGSGRQTISALSVTFGADRKTIRADSEKMEGMRLVESFGTTKDKYWELSK